MFPADHFLAVSGEDFALVVPSSLSLSLPLPLALQINASFVSKNWTSSFSWGEHAWLAVSLEEEIGRE
jgi:hypothetical protein